MGSLSSLLTNTKHSYILGLWGADRYLRTSSIGVSNTNVALLKSSLEYLLERFPEDRIKVRVYGDEVYAEFQRFDLSFCKGSKNKTTAYHVYVNSRPLVREFTYALNNRHKLQHNCVYAYFAGRFDGDGSISSKRKFCRIVYSNIDELWKDRSLLSNIKTSVYRYRSAGTYCLYFSETTLDKFLLEISKYSVSGKL